MSPRARDRAAGVAAFAAGLVFALGLGLSGMTRPDKVLGFLDVAGSWDPSLAFVMMGAIGVHAPLAFLARRRRAPVLAPKFALPAAKRVDPRLVAGAALFGVGWGLGGMCPGPALVDLASLAWPPALFVAAMAAGMIAHDRLVAARPGEAPGGSDASPASAPMTDG